MVSNFGRNVSSRKHRCSQSLITHPILRYPDLIDKTQAPTCAHRPRLTFFTLVHEHARSLPFFLQIPHHSRQGRRYKHHHLSRRPSIRRHRFQVIASPRPLFLIWLQQYRLQFMIVCTYSRVELLIVSGRKATARASSARLSVASCKHARPPECATVCVRLQHDYVTRFAGICGCNSRSLSTNDEKLKDRPASNSPHLTVRSPRRWCAAVRVVSAPSHELHPTKRALAVFESFTACYFALASCLRGVEFATANQINMTGICTVIPGALHTALPSIAGCTHAK
jgi:hypothetical protein